MAPATCLSQVLVFACAAPFAHPAQVGSGDLVLLVSLGIGQIGLGFVFLTIGGRLIPAAEVALITLLEVVLGPLWVWLVLSERPGITTVIGGVVVLAAVAIQARGSGVEQRVPVP
jgi:drug/metabolite transporter (DMT)-like permease